MSVLEFLIRSLLTFVSCLILAIIAIAAMYIWPEAKGLSAIMFLAIVAGVILITSHLFDK